MKHILFLFLVMASFKFFAVNYYVSPSGSASNSGLSPAIPKNNIENTGLLTKPGDTVFVMNGVYTNADSNANVVNIYNSGTAAHWIVFTNYPGDTPLIKSKNWSGIQVQGAAYIVIDGFRVIGYNDSVTLAYAQSQKNNTGNPITSGNGIGCAPLYNNASQRAHHIIIRNCIVSKCGGGGIYTNQSDYITVENNTVSECGWYSPYDNSGISLYQNWNSDSTTGIKNFITGNTCYSNQNYIPFYVAGVITDGNGIIIDDARNTQNGSKLGVYVGKTYIANNVVFNNGGRGIHCYSSDKVIIINNTCYYNCQSPYVQDGELTANTADSIWEINNIAYPSASIKPMDTFAATHVIVTHNLWAANSNLALPYGFYTVTGAAAFVNPSTNPIVADFHLLASSAAIHAGTRLYAPATDKDGYKRPLTDSIDIGAYQFHTSNGISQLNGLANDFTIYPNPVTQILTVVLPTPSQNMTYNIYDITGNRVVCGCVNTNICNIDVSSMPCGLYVIKLNDGGANIEGKFVVGR